MAKPKVSKPHRVENDDEDSEAATVSMSESGYKKVVKLESEHEMELFIKRVVDELGYKISDVGSLKGVIPYYSGKKAVQSYAALKEELQRVSKKKTGWARRKEDNDEEANNEGDEENEEDEKPVRKKKSVREDDEDNEEEEEEEEVPKKKKVAVENNEDEENNEEEEAVPKTVSKTAKRLHSLLEDAENVVPKKSLKKSALEDDEEDVLPARRAKHDEEEAVVPVKRAKRVVEEDEELPRHAMPSPREPLRRH